MVASSFSIFRTAAALAGLALCAGGATAQTAPAAGAPTQGQTAAGAPTQGQTAAGAPTQGQPTAGAPTAGQRSAGMPTPGQPAAGNPFATRSATASGNNLPLPSGNTSFPNTTSSNTFPRNFTPVGPNNGFFPNTSVPNGTAFTVGGGSGVVSPFGATGFVPGVGVAEGANFGSEFLPNGAMPNQFNVFTPATEAGAAMSSGGSGGSGASLTDNVARLRLLARPDAVVWVDGQRTTPGGLVREFVSPPIDPNREFGYEIRAEWNEGGKPVTRVRKVTFFAGDRLTVNLLTESNNTSSGTTRHTTLKPNAPAHPTPADQIAPAPRSNFEVATDEGADDGVVIRVTPTGLVLRAQTEREYEYELAPGAQITCDNAGCSLSALQPGMRARVTTKNNNLRSAFRVEALDRNLDYVKTTR